jgi:regulator of replication initiation timing
MHPQLDIVCSMKATIDELEATLEAAATRLKTLSDENVRLRAELAASQERMRAAGFKLRAVAERIPQEPVQATQEKAA